MKSVETARPGAASRLIVLLPDAWAEYRDRGLAWAEMGEVRLAVVEQIGQHCSLGEGTKYLILALNDSDDWVKIRAMEALAMRSAKEAIPDLVGLLDSPNKLVALKVIETMGEIGGKVAFRALLEILNAEDQELAEAAESAISKIQEEHGEDN